MSELEELQETVQVLGMALYEARRVAREYFAVALDNWKETYIQGELKKYPWLKEKE